MKKTPYKILLYNSAIILKKYIVLGEVSCEDVWHVADLVLTIRKKFEMPNVFQCATDIPGVEVTNLQDLFS